MFNAKELLNSPRFHGFRRDLSDVLRQCKGGKHGICLLDRFSPDPHIHLMNLLRVVINEVLHQGIQNAWKKWPDFRSRKGAGLNPAFPRTSFSASTAAFVDFSSQSRRRRVRIKDSRASADTVARSGKQWFERFSNNVPDNNRSAPSHLDPNDKHVHVVAAIIERDGRFLVCRRNPEKRHGGLWEFPGGKIEAGETHLDAIKRELAEELCVAVTDFREIVLSVPDPNSAFVIDFARASILGEPLALEHTEIRWVEANDLVLLDLAPSDRMFVREIIRPEAGSGSA